VWAVIQAAYGAVGTRRGTSISEALRFVRSVQRRRAVLVLVSDFLDDGPWERALGPLARKHKVHAALVHDPLDTSLRGFGLVEVVDAETGQRQLVDGASFVARQAVEQRTQRLRRSGARVVPIGTADDPFGALMTHFHREGARR
jgi:uncharacterized protein (DUF58 family)